MRAIALMALVAAIIPVCERQNPAYCTAEISCPAEQVCQIEDTVNHVGKCIPRQCLNDKDCPAAQPICDMSSGTCAKCQDGKDDQICLQSQNGKPFCKGGGCVACAADTNCSGGTPVCDPAAHQCRACQAHSECASGVCAKDASFLPWAATGYCVPASRVLSVNSSASCDKPGTMVTCTLREAVTKAAAKGSGTPFVRLLTGNGGEFSHIVLSDGNLDNPSSVFIIGPMADESPWQAQKDGTATTDISIGSPLDPSGLTVVGGYRVRLEGVLVRDSITGVDCTGTGNPGQTSLHILRSIFGNTSTAVAARSECAVSVEQSWFGHGYRNNGSVETLAGNTKSMEIMQSDLDIQNSLFWHNGLAGSFSGISLLSMVDRKTPARIINSTFVEQGYTDGVAIDLNCDMPGTKLAVVNSYLWKDVNRGMMTVPTHIDQNCRFFLGALASDDPALATSGGYLVTGNTPPDTGFRDEIRGDLHLTQNAPAGIARGGKAHFTGAYQTDAPAVDMDGRPRPGGPNVAIGCFEP